MLNFSLNAGEERQLYCAGASLFNIYIFVRYTLQKFVTMFEVHRKQYLLINLGCTVHILLCFQPPTEQITCLMVVRY